MILSSPHKARAPAGRARGARAFDELRRYHTRPLQLNWGLKNVHFEETHFRDPNINARIFFVENLNFCFAFSTMVPKNGPKNSQKIKKRQKMTKS